jgi:hypothetical protein
MSTPNLRDSAGGVELHGGTGDILHMVGLKNFLEVYKTDMTFRIQTPQTVDPQNTNPNAPWVVTRIDGVGASSFAVARGFLQGHNMLQQDAFVHELDKDTTLNQLHACKEQLVICEQTATRVAGRIEEIISRIQTSGISRDNHGRALNPFPQVQDLVADTTVFLIHAKRTITEVTALVAATIGIQVQGANFLTLGKRLLAQFGADATLAKYIQEQEPTVKYLVDLRNLQEHPKVHAIHTIVNDFHVLPDGSISPPVLYLSNQEPQSLHEHLRAAAGYLVRLTEAVFIHAIMSRLAGTFPFYVEEIEESAVNAQCPIKYRLSIDLSALPFAHEGGG